MCHDPRPVGERDARGQHRRQRLHGGAGRPRGAPLPRAAALLQHALPAQPAAARTRPECAK